MNKLTKDLEELQQTILNLAREYTTEDMPKISKYYDGLEKFGVENYNKDIFLLADLTNGFDEDVIELTDEITGKQAEDGEKLFKKAIKELNKIIKIINTDYNSKVDDIEDFCMTISSMNEFIGLYQLVSEKIENLRQGDEFHGNDVVGLFSLIASTYSSLKRMINESMLVSQFISEEELNVNEIWTDKQQVIWNEFIVHYLEKQRLNKNYFNLYIPTSIEKIEKHNVQYLPDEIWNSKLMEFVNAIGEYTLYEPSRLYDESTEENLHQLNDVIEQIFEFYPYMVLVYFYAALQINRETMNVLEPFLKTE